MPAFAGFFEAGAESQSRATSRLGTACTAVRAFGSIGRRKIDCREEATWNRDGREGGRRRRRAGRASIVAAVRRDWQHVNVRPIGAVGTRSPREATQPLTRTRCMRSSSCATVSPSSILLQLYILRRRRGFSLTAYSAVQATRHTAIGHYYYRQVYHTPTGSSSPADPTPLSFCHGRTAPPGNVPSANTLTLAHDPHDRARKP